MDAEATPSQALHALVERLTSAQWFDIGFPGARDVPFDEPALVELLTGHLLNNIGDPWVEGHGQCHTKALEREVIHLMGDYLHAPASRWGYVTTGATEAVAHVLDQAWQRFARESRDLVVFASTSAHYSVFKAAQRLRLPTVMIHTDEAGQMDLADLETELRLRRDHPALIVATAGTTMTEAIDDVAAIHKLCERLAPRRMLYVDAAHSGFPLALLPPAQRPAFDFEAGADAMVISGQKFLGTLTPCAVLIYRDNPFHTAVGRVTYTGSIDTTVSGSRSGHNVLRLWWALSSIDAEGHRKRADNARALAAYTHRRLQEMGWETRLSPHAFTVLLKRPPEPVCVKWTLAYDTSGLWAHIICAPGIVQAQIDEFLGDLEMWRYAAVEGESGPDKFAHKGQSAAVSAWPGAR